MTSTAARAAFIADIKRGDAPAPNYLGAHPNQAPNTDEPVIHGKPCPIRWPHG